MMKLDKVGTPSLMQRPHLIHSNRLMLFTKVIKEWKKRLKGI